MQIANNSLGLLLRIGLLIQLIRRVNPGCIVCPATLAHLTVESLRGRVLVHAGSVLGDGSVEITLRMNAAHFFLSPYLSNAVENRSDINIRYFYPLVALYLQLLTDRLGRPLDSK